MLAAANEQATLVCEQEQEIKGLKIQLTSGEQMASLNRKREEVKIFMILKVKSESNWLNFK